LPGGIVVRRVPNRQGAPRAADYLHRVSRQGAKGEVKEVTINGSEVHGAYQNPSLGLHTYIPINYPDLYKQLQDHSVNVEIKDSSSGNWSRF